MQPVTLSTPEADMAGDLPAGASVAVASVLPVVVNDVDAVKMWVLAKGDVCFLDDQ